MSQYPQTFEAALGQPLRFPAETLRAVRAFAASKPCRGTLEERQAKFKQIHADLCRSYSKNLTLQIQGDGTGDSGGSYYSRGANLIVLAGRLSVITFLHEWGHAVKGGSEFEACRWSLRLFQRCFPKSWSRLRFEGHVGRASGQGEHQPKPPVSKMETPPVTEEQFVMNNALLGTIVKADGKRALSMPC
jgi:hypothetical protein